MSVQNIRETSLDYLVEYLDEWSVDALAIEAIKKKLANSLGLVKRTLEYLPSVSGKLLQVGASPFFLTSVLHRHGDFELSLVDFLRQDPEEQVASREVRVIDNLGADLHISYLEFDIESIFFPYPESSFDGIILYEMLQKIRFDPVPLFAEIHRLLKPGGWLLLTTPNAAYYGNLVKVWMSNNPYARYSTQAQVDRDNRLYTIPELTDLLGDLGGLAIDKIEGRSLPGSINQDLRLRVAGLMTRLVKRNDLNEEHIFCLARKGDVFYPARPRWFFETYDAFYPPSFVPLERNRLQLPVSDPGPGRFPRRICKLCDEEDWTGEDWLGYLDDMGEPYSPDLPHRKAWEWAQGLYALHQLGLIQEDATALGVGAGTEQILFYLANRIKMVTATDIYGQGSFAGKTAQANMLVRPEQYAKLPFRRDHLTSMYMDGTNLEFPDDSFDFSFSFSSIEHFGSHEAAAQAVREMGRVTRPGGAIIITTEVVLNGADHREFFKPSQVYRYLVDANELGLLEDIDFHLSDKTLAHPVDFSHPAFERILPHVICRLGGVYWTSICLVFTK